MLVRGYVHEVVIVCSSEVHCLSSRQTPSSPTISNLLPALLVHFYSAPRSISCSALDKGSRVTSDSGLLLVRELDERFGIEMSA